MKTNNLVVCIGDSLTAGSGAERGYPAQLQAILGPQWEVVNLGVPGSYSGTSGTYDMGNIWSTYVRQKYTAATKKWLCMLIGTNDLTYNNTSGTIFTNSIIYNNCTGVWNQAGSDGGWTGGIWMTIPPRVNSIVAGAVTWTSGSIYQTNLMNLNASILAFSGTPPSGIASFYCLDMYKALQDNNASF